MLMVRFCMSVFKRYVSTKFISFISFIHIVVQQTKTYECAAVTAALTSLEFDNATLPIHLELDGFIISRYSFVVGGTISPFM